MRKFFWSLALCAISAFALNAGTLLPGPTDTNPDTNFTFTIDSTLGTENLATPGGADELTVSGIGNIFAFDGGTPGQVILGLNTGATEAVVLTFNTGALTTDVAGNVFIPATGAPSGTITDPGLLALVGASTFEFAATASTASPFVFDFTAASLPMPASGVPEPAVSLMVGLGLLGISTLRLRKGAR